MLCVLIRIASLRRFLRKHTTYHFQFKRRYPSYIILYPQPDDFFQGTQKRVRSSRGKRAISVRATEVPLYVTCGGVYTRDKCSQSAMTLLSIHLTTICFLWPDELYLLTQEEVIGVFFIPSYEKYPAEV